MGGYWQSTIPDRGIVSDSEGNFVADCGYSLSLMQSESPDKAAANAELIVKALNFYTSGVQGFEAMRAATSRLNSLAGRRAENEPDAA